MNAILEFVRAALPWAILGVAVAVLCVRHGGEKSRQDYSGESMCLGVGLGVALATALDGMEHLGLGLSLGMLAGMWPLVPVWKTRIREQTWNALLAGQTGTSWHREYKRGGPLCAGRSFWLCRIV